MFIHIVQNEVFLSEAESHQCMWAATANWKGGPGKNIEIDILQENRNKDIKKDIKEMAANKTEKAIDSASRAAGGERKMLENFDQQFVQHTFLRGAFWEVIKANFKINIMSPLIKGTLGQYFVLFIYLFIYGFLCN